MGCGGHFINDVASEFAGFVLKGSDAVAVCIVFAAVYFYFSEKGGGVFLGQGTSIDGHGASWFERCQGRGR
jgi:hypothetical protein